MKKGGVKTTASCAISEPSETLRHRTRIKDPTSWKPDAALRLKYSTLSGVPPAFISLLFFSLLEVVASLSSLPGSPKLKLMPPVRPDLPSGIQTSLNVVSASTGAVETDFSRVKPAGFTRSWRVELFVLLLFVRICWTRGHKGPAHSNVHGTGPR